MTESTANELAKAFLNDLFIGVEHGDAEHRKWLKDELVKYEPKLAKLMLAAGDLRG